MEAKLRRPSRKDNDSSNQLELPLCSEKSCRSRGSTAGPKHSVGTLCAILNIKQYAISQQLAVLRKAQIVTTRREARHVIYALTNTKVRRILTVSIANLASANSQPISDLDQEQKAGKFAKSL